MYASQSFHLVAVGYRVNDIMNPFEARPHRVRRNEISSISSRKTLRISNGGDAGNCLPAHITRMLRQIPQNLIASSNPGLNAANIRNMELRLRAVA